MSSSDTTGTMGASTEGHITGSDETGTFITDQPPTSETPANGSSNRGINTTGANRGSFTPSDAATDASADGPAVIDGVTVGMDVFDADGEQAGIVGAVQPAGTDIHPDAPAGLAEELMSTGYLQIDGAGHLANDTYAAGNQIGEVTTVVTLLVARDELIRAS
jgi:hypothetical protein